MRQLAQVALRAYPLREPRLTPLSHLFNTTFRVETPDGSRYVLRIHRSGQGDVEAVHSEMLWLDALRRETDLAVPEPVHTSDGALLTIARWHEGVEGSHTCVLFRWMDGRFFAYDTLTPSRLERVGAFTARLHQHAGQFRPPEGFTRGWVEPLASLGDGRCASLSNERVAYIRQLVAALRPPEDMAIMDAVVVKLRRALGQLGQGPETFGLIHGDLHQKNYLFHRGEVRAIDFDDCGYGYFLYDLAITLYELQYRQDYPSLRAALLAGYCRIRPLAAEHETLLESFFALRDVQLMMGDIEMREHPQWRDGWPDDVTRAMQKLRAFVEA